MELEQFLKEIRRASGGTELPAEGDMSPVKSSQPAKLGASKEEEEAEE